MKHQEADQHAHKPIQNNVVILQKCSHAESKPVIRVAHSMEHRDSTENSAFARTDVIEWDRVAQEKLSDIRIPRNVEEG